MITRNQVSLKGFRSSPEKAMKLPGELESVIELRTSRRRERIWNGHREHYRLLAENSADVIAVLSADAHIEYISPSIEKVFGYKASELTGHSMLNFVHSEDVTHVKISIAERLPIPGPAPAIDFRFKHKDGSWINIDAIMNNLVYDRNVSGIIMTLRDVTERQRMDQELRRAYNEMSQLTRELEKTNAELRQNYERLSEVSKLDSLTGMANRGAAIEFLRHHFLKWLQDGTQFSVQILDLDNFKTINDSLGHLNGDNALKLAASAIRESICAKDMASRFGGDEFLVVLAGTGLRESVVVAEKILSHLQKNSIHSEDQVLRVTASIGVATISPSDQTIDNLLNRADIALYQAKKLGKARVIASSEQLAEIA